MIVIRIEKKDEIKEISPHNHEVLPLKIDSLNYPCLQPPQHSQQNKSNLITNKYVNYKRFVSLYLLKFLSRLILMSVLLYQ